MVIDPVLRWVLIIWGSLSIILIIAIFVYGVIFYRRTQEAARKARESITTPIRRVEEGLAYLRGASQGARDAFDILRGKEKTEQDSEKVEHSKKTGNSQPK